MRVVLDTNVLVAALRSDMGASYRLMQLVGSERFEPCLSVALCCEYEAVLKRTDDERVIPESMTDTDVDVLLDFLIMASVHQKVFYLWRPLLVDGKDDMVLEVAVAAGCSAIITFNKGHFGPAAQFGIRLLRPAELLLELGERREGTVVTGGKDL